MTFWEKGVDCYLRVVRKYAVFTGRASRTEYWMFFLFNCLIAFVLGFCEAFVKAAEGLDSDKTILADVYSMVMLIPGIAVGWRRMHDTNRDGWWSLIPFVNILYSIEKGTVGENRFGSDPWGVNQASSNIRD